MKQLEELAGEFKKICNRHFRKVMEFGYTYTYRTDRQGYLLIGAYCNGRLSIHRVHAYQKDEDWENDCLHLPQYIVDDLSEIRAFYQKKMHISFYDHTREARWKSFSFSALISSDGMKKSCFEFEASYES